MPARYRDFDDYLDALAPDAREVLGLARSAVHAAVPDAGETISYQMPTFTIGAIRFLHLGGWKRHLSLYPVPELDGVLEAAVAPYRTTTATVQFPYRRGVPYELIGRIAAAIAEEHRPAAR